MTNVWVTSSSARSAGPDGGQLGDRRRQRHGALVTLVRGNGVEERAVPLRDAGRRLADRDRRPVPQEVAALDRDTRQARGQDRRRLRGARQRAVAQPVETDARQPAAQR
jgi:hypothetical protein